MSNSNRRVIVGLIGLITIAATLIIFFVGFGNSEKQTIDYLAFTFVIVSEVVLFSVFVFIDVFKNTANKVLLYSGITSTLIGYLIITVLLSIFLPAALKGNINAFITTQSIVILLTVIIILCISIAVSKKSGVNEKNEVSDRILKDCENIVFSLKNDKKYLDIREQLNNLYDELKFSDRSVFIEKDENEINTKIISLNDKIKIAENISSQGIIDSIDEITLMVKSRNQILKQSKQGGY